MEAAFSVREGAAPAATPVAPAAPAPGATGATTVDIAGFAFTPADIRVAPGNEVRWTNSDPAPHTATGTGWDTGRLGAGEAGSVTFDTPGTFSYICAIHPAMTGVVTVA